MRNIDIVLKQFPGTAMIPMVTAGSCIGYAEQTCYNLFQKGRFPIAVRKIGRKSMVSLTDLIKFLDEGNEAPGIVVEQVIIHPVEKRRAGRPTKAEQVRRLNQAS